MTRRLARRRAAAAACLGAARRAARGAGRSLARAASVDVPACSTCARPRWRAGRARLSRHRRRPLLDPRAAALRRRNGCRRPSTCRTYALLYPLLDLTTTLDPYFSIAYRFGAIFLGEPYPGGPGRPDLADRAAAERARRAAGASGSTCRTSASSTTGTCATTSRRRRRSSGAARCRARRPGCGRWPPSRWPKADSATARGRCGSSSRRPTSRGCATPRACASRSSTRWTRRYGRPWRSARAPASRRLDAWPRALPGPLDPSGTPFALDPATRRHHRRARRRSSSRCPDQLQAPR